MVSLQHFTDGGSEDFLSFFYIGQLTDIPNTRSPQATVVAY